MKCCAQTEKKQTQTTNKRANLNRNCAYVKYNHRTTQTHNPLQAWKQPDLKYILYYTSSTKPKAYPAYGGILKLSLIHLAVIIGYLIGKNVSD